MAPPLIDPSLPQPAAWKERAALFDALRETRPSDLYQAGHPERFADELDRFQLQFHKSQHIVRCMVLGNGAGKTTVAGIEADWWLQHDHPYQETPKHAVTIVWVTLAFKQMDLLRKQLEQQCFTRGWRWNESKHTYTWDATETHKGGTLTVVSADGDWKTVQGVPVDLVVFDEECEQEIWSEFQMRRRVNSKTRYVISATATSGKRWMYSDCYKPWLAAHGVTDGDEQGIRRAMREQRSEYIWCWPRGGIRDNPAHTEADVKWYTYQVAYKSPQEKHVRLQGGFIDLNQSPVFDLEALQEVEKWQRETDHSRGINGVLEKAVTRTRPKQPHEFSFLPSGGEYLGGRLTVYEAPKDDYYVIGADFAHGLATGDYDTAVVCRRGEDDRIIQVAEAHGHWGTAVMPTVLFALGWYYNEALICGEANSMGLGVLKSLYEMGYVYQYFREAKPDAKASPRTDRLGYWKGSSLPINRLQWALAPRSPDKPDRQPPRLLVRSPYLLEELRRYQRRPRVRGAALEDTPDAKLEMGAERGYHDDLVSAAAGAVMAWFDLPRFEKPAHVFEAGSLGEVLKHHEVLNPRPKNKTAFAFAKR